MPKETDITAQRLRELLAYDSETGAFTRIARTANSVHVGDAAGSKSGCGYIYISVLGRTYSAHRLAWLHVHGAWPTADIDHIDGDKANNAFSNLRDVSKNLNMQNQRRAKSCSASGFLGVSRHGSGWQATIFVDGKNRHIGTHDAPEKAHEAYIHAKRKHHAGNTL